MPVPHGGRGSNGNGASEIPPTVRKLLGTLAAVSKESCKSIANTFGVTQPTVNKAARGLIGNRLDKALAADVEATSERSLEEAHSAAIDCMMDSLTFLKPKLKDPDIKARDLSRIATDMSRVTSNIQPKGEGNNNVKVIFFCPEKQKTEKDYDVIDV